MPQEKLPEDFPAFLDTNTLRDMSEVAKKVALAESFVALIAKTEDELLSGAETDSRRFQDVAQFALQAAKAAREARNILGSVKANASAFGNMVKHVAY